MAVSGILGSDFFVYVILPFLLIFVVVYAILDKTKILGEKRDINATVALVFGLVTVGLPSAFGAVDVIIKLVPIVAVIVVTLLAFMLTYGFIGGTEKGFLSPPWKRFFAILLGLGLLATILWATGAIDLIISKSWASQAVQTVIIVGAVVAVVSIITSGPVHHPPEKTQ